MAQEPGETRAVMSAGGQTRIQSADSGLELCASSCWPGLSAWVSEKEGARLCLWEAGQWQARVPGDRVRLGGFM